MGGDTLESLIADFTEQRAVDWAVRKFEHFDPSWTRELAVGETKNEQAYFRRARIVGCIRKLPESMKSGANRPVLVAVVEMKNPLMERTSRQIQFAFAKKILQNAVREGAMGLDGFPSQGLFFFYDRDRFFRLSLVSGEVENRRFKFNEAKRQSFYVNPSRPNNVLKSRLSASIATFADLKEAFSVETLTREFYGRLFAWYEWAMDVRTGVTFPNDSQDATANRRYNNEAVIRLITRLMFVWFIRQRNLVPGILFAVEGVAKLLKDFQATSMEADNYYQAILQNLFFATLNSPIEKRGFIPAKRYKGANAGYFVKTRYRHAKTFKDPARFKDEVMAAVPFLNCALFDCLDKQDHETGRLMLFDGFSENPKRQAHVPNGLFFHPEKGLIPLFERYEFTIDENNADDADVALDPELLGKVFENLLGAFNPETKETARKATGSFYTPREIVDYMVEEALKNHLKTHLAKKHSNEDIDTWLKDLFSTVRADEGAELPFGEGVRAEIAEALYSCKILDPACGSGAFPMGVLHAMVRLFQRLDPDNTDLNERLLKRYSDDKKRVLEGYCTPDEREEWLETLKLQLGESQRFPNYARKLYLIENCIHGIDIQPIACQISKLRFFISLLCDQLRSNFNQEAKNHGLLALPNLEAKFVCANTLVSLPKVDDELALGSQEIAALRERLQTNRHHIFRARTYSQKERYRKNDEAIRDQIKAAVKTQLGHPDDELVKLERDVIAKLRKDRETVAEPRLKTVRKPIQGDLFGGSEQEGLAFETVDVNQRRRDQIDAQIAAAERAIAKELDKASPRHAQAIDQLAGLVASWDPYDQNKVSPFFDMKWMFNMEAGFDIVIGNPPYVQLQANGGELAKTYQGCGYESFCKTGDLYCLFYERGFQLSNKLGTVCYITSNKWMRASYGQVLRRYFSARTNPIMLIDFAGEKVFESASVDTNILILEHGENRGQTLSVIADEECRSGLSRFVSEHAFVNSYTKDDTWLILSGAEQKLSESLMKGIRIDELPIQINLGVKSGFNDAFIINDETRTKILSECSDCEERIRTQKLLVPILRGRDVLRYGKRWAGLYLVGMHNGTEKTEREMISRYPALKHFMDQFIGGLSGRCDKGDTPYNLRDCAYWDDFGKPKLIWADIMRVRKSDDERFPRFSYDEEGTFANNSCYMAVGKDLKYVLGVLNSTIGKYQCLKEIVVLDNGGFRMWKDSVGKLRIPKATSVEKQSVILLVSQILAAKKVDPNADTSALEAEIDQLVYKLYDLTPEEIAIVEGKGKMGSDDVDEETKKQKSRRAVKPKVVDVVVDGDEDLE